MAKKNCKHGLFCSLLSVHSENTESLLLTEKKYGNALLVQFSTDYDSVFLLLTLGKYDTLFWCRNVQCNNVSLARMFLVNSFHKTIDKRIFYFSSLFFFWGTDCFTALGSETYSGPCETSMMEIFVKIVNSF